MVVTFAEVVTTSFFCMAQKRKLIPLSRIKPKVEMDSIKEVKRLGDRRAFNVLMEAQASWDSMGRFRLDRERNKRYAYGDQWGDIITADGEHLTEEEYIQKQGNIPLKNNLIRRVMRNVLGVYRGQSKEPTCAARDRDEKRLGETMSEVLKYNMQLNRRSELDARCFEEYLISGMVVNRKWYGWRNDKLDCWTDYVNPNNFFIDCNMRDFRGWDCNLVGEVHDVSFETLCSQFAESAEDYSRLSRIYSRACKRDYIAQSYEEFGYSRIRNYDFLLTTEAGRCRVIEVWRKESKPRYRCHDYNNGDVYKIEVEDYAKLVEVENAIRIAEGTALGMAEDDIPLIHATWFIDDYWYFYYLSPFGDILKEGETPYEHKGHPYVFKAYPFIDGEIHSFVADVIDQQRYVNRLITMHDWIMRASAKGLLLFPEECKPDDMSMEEIADEWSRFNGIIMYKPKAGVPAPQQISNNSTNIGISELLNLQLKLFEDISGVNGALQGKPGYSGTSAALYSQQAQNSASSLLDILDSFSMFIVDGAYKDVKNIQQFYDSKRIFNIKGNGAQVEYDPKKVRDVEFDLSIVESSSTPVHRQLANDFLMEIWRAGQISVQQLLQVGDFPFADELLQSLQSQQEQLENGQTPEGLSPEVLQQAQQGANMDAVNQMYNAVRQQAA